MLLASFLAGCSGSAVAPSAPPPTGSTDPSAGSPAASTTASASEPVGVIAIGHSGLTGEGTGAPFEPVYRNSWATGTSPEVNSVYLRLVDVRPETEGHVSNQARGGAVAAELEGQAAAALADVPAPELAIVSTIDNDIRCDGNDPERVREFGRSVERALDLISSTSPTTKILVVGQLGRPSPDFIEQLVTHEPDIKASLTGNGPCDFFRPDGSLALDGFETLTGIIEAYEAEQARVCEATPNCRTDGGVRAAYVDKLDNFAPDWAHLNVTGQAAVAALIWPVVEEFLGI